MEPAPKPAPGAPPPSEQLTGTVLSAPVNKQEGIEKISKEIFSLPVRWKIFLPTECKIHKNVGQTSPNPSRTRSSRSIGRPSCTAGLPSGQQLHSPLLAARAVPKETRDQRPRFLPEQRSSPSKLLLISWLLLAVHAQRTTKHPKLSARAARVALLCIPFLSRLKTELPQQHLLLLHHSASREALGCWPFPFLKLFGAVCMLSWSKCNPLPSLLRSLGTYFDFADSKADVAN